MSARPSLPWAWPSARPLSRLWKDSPPRSWSMVAAIQASSACSSGASCRVTAGSWPGAWAAAWLAGGALRAGTRVVGAMACRAAVAMAGGAGGGSPPAGDQGGRGDGLQGSGPDGGGRSVVPAGLDGGRAGEVGGEPGEDGGVRAAEAVDGLLRVADRGHGGAVAGDGPEQGVLHGVDVLVLVHADPRPAGAQAGGKGEVLAQQGGGDLDQAVEVDQVASG